MKKGKYQLSLSLFNILLVHPGPWCTIQDNLVINNHGRLCLLVVGNFGITAGSGGSSMGNFDCTFVVIYSFLIHAN